MEVRGINAYSHPIMMEVVETVPEDRAMDSVKEDCRELPLGDRPVAKNGIMSLLIRQGDITTDVLPPHISWSLLAKGIQDGLLKLYILNGDNRTEIIFRHWKEYSGIFGTLETSANLLKRAGEVKAWEDIEERIADVNATLGALRWWPVLLFSFRKWSARTLPASADVRESENLDNGANLRAFLVDNDPVYSSLSTFAERVARVLGVQDEEVAKAVIGSNKTHVALLRDPNGPRRLFKAMLPAATLFSQVNLTTLGSEVKTHVGFSVCTNLESALLAGDSSFRSFFCLPVIPSACCTASSLSKTRPLS